MKSRANQAEFWLSVFCFVVSLSLVWFCFSYLLDLFPKIVSKYIFVPIIFLYSVVSFLVFCLKCLQRTNDTGNNLLDFILLLLALPFVYYTVAFELIGSVSNEARSIGQILTDGPVFFAPFVPLLAKCALQPTNPKFSGTDTSPSIHFAKAAPVRLSVVGGISVAAMMLGVMLFTDSIWLKRGADLNGTAFYSATPRGIRNIIQCNNVNGVVVDVPETRLSGYSGMSRDGFKDATFVFSFKSSDQIEGYIDVNVISPVQSMSLASDGMRFEIENTPVSERGVKLDGSDKTVQAFLELPLEEATQKIRSEKPDSFTINGVDENTPPSDFRSKRIEKFIFNKINDYGGYQLTYIRHLRGDKNGLFGMVFESKYDFERTSVFLGTCMLAL
jgi:uncharacterized membrane protein YhaH (DUF805 family)